MSNVVSIPWVIHGPNWSLPVWVHEMHGLMRVKPHGCLTRLMRTALNKRLSELGTSNGEDWFLTKGTLEKFADEALHTHGERPEDYISWVSHPGRVALTEQPAGMEGLYEELVRSGFAISVPKAQLLYGILCQSLLDRLVVQKKPVELGFATLQAVPLRSDWIRLLDRRTKRRMMYGTGPFRDKLIQKAIRNGRLLAFHKSRKILLWNIAVRPNRYWWQGVTKSEKHLRGKRGGVRYMVHIRDRLRGMENILYGIFKDYFAEAIRPALKIPARLGRSHGTHGEFIKPTLRPVHKLVRGRKGARNVDGRPGGKGGPETVGQEGADVPALPHLQQAPGDVRDAGGDVVQPGDEAGGTGGVPLCDVGKIEPPVE